MEVNRRGYCKEVAVHNPEALVPRCRVGIPKDISYACCVLFTSAGIGVIKPRLAVSRCSSAMVEKLVVEELAVVMKTKVESDKSTGVSEFTVSFEVFSCIPELFWEPKKP